MGIRFRAIRRDFYKSDWVASREILGEQSTARLANWPRFFCREQALEFLV